MPCSEIAGAPRRDLVQHERVVRSGASRLDPAFAVRGFRRMPARAVRIRTGPIVVAACAFVASQSLLAGAARADDLFLPAGAAGEQARGMRAAASESASPEFLGATLRRRQARIDLSLLTEARAAAVRGGWRAGARHARGRFGIGIARVPGCDAPPPAGANRCSLRRARPQCSRPRRSDRSEPVRRRLIPRLGFPHRPDFVRILAVRAARWRAAGHDGPGGQRSGHRR